MSLVSVITSEILDLHRKYLAGEESGVRLVTVVGKVEISADLSGADLRSADLSRANLRSANLSGANLRSANLSGADLSGANLRSANLSGADLRSANLSGANLRSADLSGADLSGANLRSANLSGADLRSADLSGADLRSADLSGAKNLLNPVAWLSDNFCTDDLGYIVYKAIGGTSYQAPDAWKIEAGSLLEEVCNPDRGTTCASGVNFGTLKWVEENYPACDGREIWRCRIRWLDLPGVVVPFMTDGKARCNRLELIEVIHANT